MKSINIILIFTIIIMIIGCQSDKVKITRSYEFRKGQFLGARAQDGLANIYTQKVKNRVFYKDTIRTFLLQDWYDIEFYEGYTDYLLFKFPEGDVKITSYDFENIDDSFIAIKREAKNKELERAKKFKFDLATASESKLRSFLNGSWEGFLYLGIIYGEISNFMYYAEFSGNNLRLYRKGPGTVDELEKQSKALIYSGSYLFGSVERGASWLNSNIKISDSQIVRLLFNSDDGCMLYLEKSLEEENENYPSLTEVKLVVQFGTAYVNMDKIN
jgi:hypothetical protein